MLVLGIEKMLNEGDRYVGKTNFKLDLPKGYNEFCTEWIWSSPYYGYPEFNF